MQGAGSERLIRETTKTPVAFDDWDRARAYWRGLRPMAEDDAIEQRVRETLRVGADGKVVWRFDWAGIRKTRLARACCKSQSAPKGAKETVAGGRTT